MQRIRSTTACEHHFDFIPSDHVIIDTLHLFLRISDVLIELLIRQLKREDAIDKKSTVDSGFAQDKFKHMDAYEKFLRSLGIAFEWTVDRDSKKLSYRDLTGPEKLLVFQKITIKELLPRFADSNKIENLWKSFIDLFGELKLDYSTDNKIEAFRQNVKKWTEEFLFCIKQVMSPHICMLLECMCQKFWNCIKTFLFSISKALRNIMTRHLRITLGPQIIEELILLNSSC